MKEQDLERHNRGNPEGSSDPTETRNFYCYLSMDVNFNIQNCDLGLPQELSEIWHPFVERFTKVVCALRDRKFVVSATESSSLDSVNSDGFTDVSGRGQKRRKRKADGSTVQRSPADQMAGALDGVNDVSANLGEGPEEKQDDDSEPYSNVNVNLHNDGQMMSWYERCMRHIQQTECRALGQIWVRVVHPRKQSVYPYNGGKDRRSNAPPWWPEGVRHVEPAHLKTEERLRLLLQILCKLRHGGGWGPEGDGVDVEHLKQSTDADPKLQPKTRKWLGHIYDARKAQQDAEDGCRPSGNAQLPEPPTRKSRRAGQPTRRKLNDIRDDAVEGCLQKRRGSYIDEPGRAYPDTDPLESGEEEEEEGEEEEVEIKGFELGETDKDFEDAVVVGSAASCARNDRPGFSDDQWSRQSSGKIRGSLGASNGSKATASSTLREVSPHSKPDQRSSQRTALQEFSSPMIKAEIQDQHNKGRMWQDPHGQGGVVASAYERRSISPPTGPTATGTHIPSAVQQFTEAAGFNTALLPHSSPASDIHLRQTSGVHQMPLTSRELNALAPDNLNLAWESHQVPNAMFAPATAVSQLDAQHMGQWMASEQWTRAALEPMMIPVNHQPLQPMNNAFGYTDDRVLLVGGRNTHHRDGIEQPLSPEMAGIQQGLQNFELPNMASQSFGSSFGYEHGNK